ncbi:MAG: hypothetical protein ABSA64_11345 [Sedimentisphaerales bacterium]|jgi:hypothetical protein
MTETKTEKQEVKKRERSPVYPVIGLGEAVGKVRALYGREGRNYAPRATAAKAMGYASLSGRSLQILASIYQYGLIERKKGEIKISDEGFTVVNAPENSEEWLNVLAECSLKPAIFGSIYDTYPDSLPSDETLIWYLKKKGFLDDAAKTITQCYKETIELAKPKGHKTADTQEKDNQNAPPEKKWVDTGWVANTKTNSLVNAEAWHFPLLTKKAIVNIVGDEPPTQEDVDLLIKLLEGFKLGLHSKKQPDNTVK